MMAPATPGTWRLQNLACTSSEWLKLLAEHEHLVFQEPVWARVTQDGLSGNPLCLGLVRDGELVGGLIGFERRIAWAKMIFMTVPYGGVLGEAPEGGELVRLLREYGRRAGVTRIRLVDAPGMNRTPQDGFEVVQGNSFILDLEGQTFEQVWTGYKKTIRRDIRIAERNGLEVERVTEPSGVQAFYDLYLESMRRNRAVPKYGYEFTNAVYRHLCLAGRADYLLARKDGEAVAGIMLVDSDCMSHYLMAGSRTETLRLCPNDLLLNAAIKRTIDKGFGALDFMGSDGLDPALEHFKSKWGARPVSAPSMTLVVRPVSMRLWDMAYSLARHPLALRLIARHQKNRQWQI